MTERARLCPYCYAGTPPEQTQCWMCGSALPPFEQRLPGSTAVAPIVPAGLPVREAERAAREQPARRTEPDFVLWAMGSLIAIALMGVLVVEIAIFYRGLAVLAAAACVPVLVVLARMLWVRRPKDPQKMGEAVTQVLGTVALGIAGVLAVIGIIVLFVIALVVLLVVACFALLFATGGPRF